MTMTMRESATRHMAAGVMDLDELSSLIEKETGRAPNRKALSSYCSRFRRHGEAWVEADRALTNEASKRWREAHPPRSLLRQCRASAKARGHECTITEADIGQMLAPMTCSATGLPLTWEHDGSTKYRPWAPSIDRIDGSKGYVPGNVRVVCLLYNQMRSNHRDEDLLKVAVALAARAP